MGGKISNLTISKHDLYKIEADNHKLCERSFDKIDKNVCECYTAVSAFAHQLSKEANQYGENFY